MYQRVRGARSATGDDKLAHPAGNIRDIRPVQFLHRTINAATIEDPPVYELVILAVAATLNLSSLANANAGTRPPCAASTAAQAVSATRPHTVCVVDPEMIGRN